MKASETINKMKSTLFEDGWCQTKLEDDDGHVCIVGSLRKVLTGDADILLSMVGNNDLVDFYFKVEDLILEQLPKFEDTMIVMGIGDWNDIPERSFDEVIDLLDKSEKAALIKEQS